MSRGPLLRVRLLKLGEKEHVFLETMHHITTDGWSWGVFHRELLTIYDAYRQGRARVLDTLQLPHRALSTLAGGGSVSAGYLLTVGSRVLARLPAGHLRGG